MGFSFEQVNATDYDELRPTYAPGSVRWVAERARLEPGALVVERERASSPIVEAYYSWFEPPEHLDGFTTLERRSFPTTRTMASARLGELFATSSDIASLPEPQRSRLLARIGELAAELPETVELAERSDVHLWFRDGSGG